MPTESFKNILTCFFYVLKFTFIGSDKVNHIRQVAINIVRPKLLVIGTTLYNINRNEFIEDDNVYKVSIVFIHPLWMMAELLGMGTNLLWNWQRFELYMKIRHELSSEFIGLSTVFPRLWVKLAW